MIVTSSPMKGYLKIKLPDNSETMIALNYTSADGQPCDPFAVVPAGSTVLDYDILTNIAGLKAIKAMGRDKTNDRI